MENVTGELMFSIKIIEYEEQRYKKNILFANLKAILGQTVTIRVEKDKRKISLSCFLKQTIKFNDKWSHLPFLFFLIISKQSKLLS